MEGNKALTCKWLVPSLAKKKKKKQAWNVVSKHRSRRGGRNKMDRKAEMEKTDTRFRVRPDDARRSRWPACCSR